MHILLIPSWYPTQPDDVSGCFFRDQARALSIYGHNVGVVAVLARPLRSVGEASIPPISFEDDDGIPTYRDTVWSLSPRVPYVNYWLWRQKARYLFQQYLREQGVPDIIHAHSVLFGGAVAVGLGNSQGIPVVLTEHSSGFFRRVYRPWQLRLAAIAAERANQRIAVSPGLGNILEKSFPAAGTWDWIPNVVAERFEVQFECLNAVTNSRPVRLLNLAVMTSKKGQADLLRAFASAFGARRDVELWFGGDGPERASLENLASSLNIQELVKFLGFVPPGQVPNLLHDIDVMVVSSYFETFGMVAAEALMMGKPVVATRCCGPEYIVGSADGVLVEPGSPDDLARGLIHVTDNLSGYPADELALRARQRFGCEAVAERLTLMYRRAMSRALPGTTLHD